MLSIKKEVWKSSSLEEEMVTSEWWDMRWLDEGFVIWIEHRLLEVDLLWENSELNFDSPKQILRALFDKTLLFL